MKKPKNYNLKTHPDRIIEKVKNFIDYFKYLKNPKEY